MSKHVKRIFNYVKLLDDVKKQSNKNQVQISEDLGCSIIHTSNVNRERSNYSLEKIIKLINSGSYCIDDYVELEGKIAISSDEFHMEKFSGIHGDILKEVIRFVQSYIQVARREKEKSEYLNERLIKMAGAKVRQLRKERGIRAGKMAEELNMKEGSYRNMENGSTGTTIDNYARIARICGVPLSMIFEDVLEDKSAILQYELETMFADLQPADVEKYSAMLGELLEVVRKYTES